MTSTMTPKETIQRFSESLKLAASRCREIGKVQNKPTIWNNIAMQLDGIRKNGEAIYVSKALTRAQVLASLDQHQKEIKIQ